MPTSGRPERLPIEIEPVAGMVLAGDDAGEGPPVVLLHGLTATRRNVVQGSRHLLSRGQRLIGYDARGHGESAPAPDPGAYGYARLSDDLEALLDALALDEVVLVGSSMGAATAIRFALAHPERVGGLVQITPAYRDVEAMSDAELAHWDRLADALAAGDLDAFVDASGANDLPERWREPARLATRQRLERHRRPDAVADAVRVVPRSQAFDSLGRLAEIEVPVLVVGSRDSADPLHPLATAVEYAEGLPRGELVVEDEGDTPLAWQGARLSRAIGDFLDRSQL
jgi:pimeloyl-ACP methyl ester carboxylesterase